MPSLMDGISFSELPIAEDVEVDDYVAILDVSVGVVKIAEAQQIAPPPVDVVEEGNMHYVTSNAVARDIGQTVSNLQEELSETAESLETEIGEVQATLQNNLDQAVL